MARRRVGYWALHLVAALLSAPLLHLQSTSLPSWLVTARPSMEGGFVPALSQHSPQHLWQCQSRAGRMLLPLLLCPCGAGGQLGHSAIASALWHLQCLRVLLLSLICCHEAAAGLERFGSSLGVSCGASPPLLTAAERGAACAALELQQQRWGFPKGERFALCSSSEERALAPAAPPHVVLAGTGPAASPTELPRWRQLPGAASPATACCLPAPGSPPGEVAPLRRCLAGVSSVA